jgi:hypothetical protein
MGTGSKGHKQRNHSFVNMLLANFSAITNLHPAIHNKDQQALAPALARCSLLLLGSDALTPSIIQRVWGANNTIQQKLGGPGGDLSLIRQCLMSLSKIPINIHHLWATTDFNNEGIINNYALHCHPQGFRDIIKSLQDSTTAKYVHEPLALGTARINILLANICNSVVYPSSIAFEDAIVPWYTDLLLHGRSATDTTGIKDKIFQAFGVAPPAHTS